MKKLTRITFDPNVMGGKPCIRGMRVTVGAIVGLAASGRTNAEILEAYPYLEPEDIQEALEYDAHEWDLQFEPDVRNGKLDNLTGRAVKDFQKGDFTKL